MVCANACVMCGGALVVLAIELSAITESTQQARAPTMTLDPDAVASTVRIRMLNLQCLVCAGGCPSVADAQRAEAAVWARVTQAHKGFHVHAYVHEMHQLHGSWARSTEPQELQELQTSLTPGPRSRHHRTLDEVIAMTDISSALHPQARVHHKVNRVCPKCKQETLEFHLLQRARGDEAPDAFDICSDAVCGFKRKR